MCNHTHILGQNWSKWPPYLTFSHILVRCIPDRCVPEWKFLDTASLTLSLFAFFPNNKKSTSIIIFLMTIEKENCRSQLCVIIPHFRPKLIKVASLFDFFTHPCTMYPRPMCPRMKILGYCVPYFITFRTFSTTKNLLLYNNIFND